jgi:mRNA-degrading endonuclease toxin of MazEF toxin-antitoxin module
MHGVEIFNNCKSIICSTNIKAKIKYLKIIFYIDMLHQLDYNCIDVIYLEGKMTIAEMKSIIAGLETEIAQSDGKHQDMIYEWLNVWTKYLKWEVSFNPMALVTYRRGDIVFVNFGYNIGSEYGGMHYAVVIEKDNPRSSGNVVVVPLTSIDSADIATIHDSEIVLGNGVIPCTTQISVAKVLSVRSISKIRIYKPRKANDQVYKLNPAQLDLIDQKIAAYLTK